MQNYITNTYQVLYALILKLNLLQRLALYMLGSWYFWQLQFM